MYLYNYAKGGVNMSIYTDRAPITALSGVGKSRAEKFKKLGIHTLGDLVRFFPRAYERRGDVRLLSQFNTEIPSAFLLTVASEVRSANIRKGLTISKFRAFDDSGSVEIVFFNSPFIKDVFHIGSTFRFWGKPSISKNKLQLTNPKYEPYVEGIPLPDFVPIYPETEGLSSKQIDKLIKLAIDDILPKMKDPLPDEIRINASLPTLSYAVLNAHFPESESALSKSLSRLAFDEMLYFGIGISMSAVRKMRGEGVRFSPCSLKPITDSLPYELSASQKSAINDIYRDTVIGDGGRVSPMARIIVGDVGCGKTICALSAMYIAAMSKYQSALMVPTEILARQHYEDARELFDSLGVKVELILGSTTQKEKKRIYALAESGEVDILIGTHSLISDKLNFKNLGLVITDEQHRFGVAQRATLKEKSGSAHLLVMSATPIPRTLALALYGDLDVSKITEMPSGRQRVDTFVVDESYRSRLNDFINKQVMLGGQCYIVCPSIESSEEGEEVLVSNQGAISLVPSPALNLHNATEYAEDLKKALPNIRIAVLHGRMRTAEKDEIMAMFSSGEIDVLVSTTVIEVGVNVPNASLMIVENAERFGLSQLHQLRGRVGRGARKSYCILVSDMKAEKSSTRLEVMRTVYDGYEIAEKDLMLRGPGDFFSSNSDNIFRQSGGFNFRFATMCNDDGLFKLAFSCAKSIVSADPKLELPEHSGIKSEIEKYVIIDSSSIS